MMRKARLGALKSDAAELQATHGLASTELNKAALATLASEPGPRPATAYTIIHAATSNDPAGRPARVDKGRDGRAALRLPAERRGALFTSARRSQSDGGRPARLRDALQNPWRTSPPKSSRSGPAGARCASTKAPPERRRRVYRALLEHPPQQSSDEVSSERALGRWS